MSLFKQRKSKRFNYIPRSDRHATNDDDLKQHWDAVKAHSKRKNKPLLSLPLLLIFLGMIIVVWYVLTQYQTT